MAFCARVIPRPVVRSFPISRSAIKQPTLSVKTARSLSIPSTIKHPILSVKTVRSFSIGRNALKQPPLNNKTVRSSLVNKSLTPFIPKPYVPRAGRSGFADALEDLLLEPLIMVGIVCYMLLVILAVGLLFYLPFMFLMWLCEMYFGKEACEKFFGKEKSELPK